MRDRLGRVLIQGKDGRWYDEDGNLIYDENGRPVVYSGLDRNGKKLKAKLGDLFDPSKSGDLSNAGATLHSLGSFSQHGVHRDADGNLRDADGRLLIAGADGCLYDEDGNLVYDANGNRIVRRNGRNLILGADGCLYDEDGNMIYDANGNLVKRIPWLPAFALIKCTDNYDTGGYEETARQDHYEGPAWKGLGPPGYFDPMQERRGLGPDGASADAKGY